jgi:nitroreductase
MFNDLSSPISLLLSRRSGKPRDMIVPGPDVDQLAQILAAATRVPDHGKLAPWRFVVIGDDRRDAFAAMLQTAWKVSRGTAEADDVKAIDQFARQAPSLVVLLSTPDTSAKIPLWEQQLSAGAAAMQALNAAHALGFVGSWITGWASYDDHVAARLGLSGAEARIAGFLFFGTPGQPLEERPRPDPSAVISYWQG